MSYSIKPPKLLQVSPNEPLTISPRECHNLTLLPVDTLKLIINPLRDTDLANCSSVCRQWSMLFSVEGVLGDLVLKKKISKEQEMRKPLGDVEEIQFPENINEILRSPCPFWKGKKTWETHRLVLISKNLNGRPQTLNRIFEVVKIPPYTASKRKSIKMKGLKDSNPGRWKESIVTMRKKEGLEEKEENLKEIPCFNFLNTDVEKEYGNSSTETSYWLLITKEPILQNVSSLEEAQETIAKITSSKYEIPKTLEVVIDLLTHIFSKGKEPEFSTSENYTICSDLSDSSPVLVGGYAPSNYIEGQVHNGSFYILTMKDCKERKPNFICKLNPVLRLQSINP